jgi:hypothetical protein
MDRDTAANIDRLTAQVARLNVEKEAYYDERNQARELAETLRSELEGKCIHVQRLQESLTAVEQDRDDFKRIVEVWRKRHGGAEDRVRVLEGAIERIDFANRQHEDVMRGANGFTRTIRDEVIAALTPAPPASRHTLECNEGMTYGDSCSCAPPAETPVPTRNMDDPESRAFWEKTQQRADAFMKRAPAWLTGKDDAPVARDASVDECVPRVTRDAEFMDRHLEIIRERDELRAELAAANEEIARLTTLANNERAAWEMATRAHAATTAKLGRAVAFLMKRNYSSPTNNHESFDWYRERDAILADADGTQAAEAWTVEREVIDAAKAFRASGVPHEHWVRLWNALDALAAVDARRGGV